LFATPAHAVDQPYLQRATAERLRDAAVAVVGIDSRGRPRPPHPHHVAAGGIPIVEHLTNLAALPPAGFRFTAVPQIEEMGTFTVRAFAET
jgi:kynurenine formamidase